ncbi:MAG TPA: MFS transporter [Nitrososphaera sp.]
MTEEEKEKAGRKNIYALGFVSFFTDVSSEMVFALLPLFLTGPIGASRTLLGLIEGMGEMLGYSVRMGSGALSDRSQRRKPLVALGYSLSAASKPFFGAAAGWVDAFVVRSLDRVGKGVRTAPRDALISESAPEAKVGRAFGIHRTMDQAGAIVGPALAFALFPYIGFSGVFYASLLPGAVAVALLVLFVKERLAPSSSSRSRSVSANVRAVLSQRKFVALLAIMAVFGIGAFNFSFVLVRASDLGVPEGSVALVYLVINAAHAAIGYPAGILADKAGKERMLALAYGVFAASAFLMLASANAAQAYVLAVVYGAYVGLAETVQRAVIPRYVSAEHRGTAYGLYNLVAGFSFLAANVVFGFLLDSSGIGLAATYSMITSALAAAAMIAFIIKK